MGEVSKRLIRPERLRRRNQRVGNGSIVCKTDSGHEGRIQEDSQSIRVHVGKREGPHRCSKNTLLGIIYERDLGCVTDRSDP